MGATTFHSLANVDGLHVGDEVRIVRPSTAEWIASIGMHQFPGRAGGDFRFSWLPGKMDIAWRRRIIAIGNGEVTIDAPLTTALESKAGSASFGGGTVSTFTWPGRISQVGIEGLRCESDFDPANPHDEQHAWIAIGMESVQNAWVRQVTAVHFASAAVNLLETTDTITVEDCRSLDPVSEPPPFENRKRILMADAFYDVTVPSRRAFHRAFIRKSLDNLAGNTNVIQVIGEGVHRAAALRAILARHHRRMGARNRQATPHRIELHQRCAGCHPRRPGPVGIGVGDRNEVLVAHRQREAL